MKSIVCTLLLCLALAPASAQEAPKENHAEANGAIWQQFNEQERAWLAQAEAFLNRLDTVKAGFIQRSPGGAVASGTFWLARPGRLRFEYAEPVADFIVADGTFLYYWDAELETRSSQPIEDSLANFLLREQVRLHGAVKVEDVWRHDGNIAIKMVQKDDPGAGSLTLVFQQEPFKLTQWAVVDGQGRLTEVRLIEPRYGVDLSKDLFYFEDPRDSEYRDRR